MVLPKRVSVSKRNHNVPLALATSGYSFASLAEDFISF